MLNSVVMVEQVSTSEVWWPKICLVYTKWLQVNVTGNHCWCTNCAINLNLVYTYNYYNEMWALSKSARITIANQNDSLTLKVGGMTKEKFNYDSITTSTLLWHRRRWPGWRHRSRNKCWCRASRSWRGNHSGRCSTSRIWIRLLYARPLCKLF